MLPTGSKLVLHWRDAHGHTGMSAVAGTPEALREQAVAALEGCDQGRHRSRGGTDIEDVWEEAGLRIAVAARSKAPLTDETRSAWLAVARRTVAAALASERSQARIEALVKAQRLQRALYEIADLAGSGLEMPDMLARIHAVVGGLMPAENFYIVLYDDEARTVRFLYFADAMDTFVADPEQALPLSEMSNSLTVALLNHGKPLVGPSEELRSELGVPRDPQHGPDSADWLGVPLLRDGRVCGAIVVQSYDVPSRYSGEEQALLEYVAQHILTALDRKNAQVELENRVRERTRDLQRANDELQAEIVERQRAEQLQRALYRITELSVIAGSLERFYAEVHAIVGELLYARNFYIALMSADGQLLEFPYIVDERDVVSRTRKPAKGLTEYVMFTGEPLLADRARIDALHGEGKVQSVGAHARCWLGVPLVRDDDVVGVIAVQSYTPDIAFTERDQELLTFVAHHIGGSLERKRAQEHIKVAHAELESRVESRTSELAEANRQLRAQIGERVRAEQRLTHQARHDDLTGLPNRAHLIEQLDAAIERARDGDDSRFAMLFLDLDRFKLVNDSIGHASGDDMLIEVGRRISGVLGKHDTVARLGGDEFAVLLERMPSPVHAEEVAAQLLGVLGQPMVVAGRELFPSASIGIALWGPGYERGEELLRDADAAMYRAKSGGRDRSMLFDAQMRAEALRLLDLEADLRRAINREAFEPWMQPIVRLSDGEVVGHEALLRWNHEQQGPLSPDAFIGVGEDNGLIEQVDWLMYRRVFEWLASHEGGGYVSINVSPSHFRSEDFASRLLGLVSACGADPNRLRIEITEVTLLDDAPRALRTLNELRENGVYALLDDFGTGFSALSYLHRFPIQCLKIDRSFVAGLEGESHMESLALIRAILALAATLGIDAVGEGVETAYQSDTLRDLGCVYGQGFLFGHPQPVSPPALHYPDDDAAA
ncbi:EAL domain-containing protein [Pseudoluteimonas lycopersici]|uniref:EAL domain-containing protein n=2 Tax=Pseudoluteimonas lycopersici TaxID=1324796 RepID=A0A516V858_9GAMM|nr:EAL domain-containing protein [Lysobacter lycopersici]